MTPLAWCVILLAAGIGCIFLEMFLPSAGVLSVLAAIFVVAAIVMAYYYHGLAVGTGFLAAASVAIPGSVALAVRWYPQTPFGRLLLPEPPSPEEVEADELLAHRARDLKGKIGKAKTTMLPGGTVRIERETFNAVSETGVIEAGELVVVLRVDGNHLIVRRAEGDALEDKNSSSEEEKNRDDILSQPIESLGLESFDDPLA